MLQRSRHRLGWIVVGLVVTGGALAAQTAPPPTQTPIPRPTPFPGSAQPPTSTPKPATPTPTPTQTDPSACPALDPATIDPSLVGIPIYPCAVYLEAFEVGSDQRAQRLFVFGTNDTYAAAVNFYKTQLKKSGEEVSRQPPIFQFERGAFDSGTMAQRPGVIVKDYAWPAATDAYLHVAGTTGTRYRTLIQIIPASR